MEALERFWEQLLPREELRPLPLEGSAGVVFCGMGGSGVVGSLCARLLEEKGFEKPLFVVKDYRLPPAVRKGYAALCVSYSGNTEETLHNFRQLLERGIKPVCLTSGGKLAEEAKEAGCEVHLLPGGYQPRFALGFMLSKALLLLGFDGERLKKAAHFLKESLPRLKEKAQKVAERLYGYAPLLVATPLTAAAAERWKAQINENAKSPAYAVFLPEAHHNEVMGWVNPHLREAFSFLLFEDSQDHPRNLKRVDVTEALLKDLGVSPLRLKGEGEDYLQRLLYLLHLGDWVSVFLAEAYRYDPETVPLIKGIKERLSNA